MILTVENGCFAYPHSERTVLRDICFSAAPGDVLAILGPNGAGKTTLLRCTMGLLAWQHGSSRLDGRSIRAIPPRELWSAVSYVPQAREASCAYTVEEMVLLGRSSRLGLFSQPRRADLKMAEAVLDRFGLLHIRHKKCAEISGGELQMVLMARALASEPQILVLDEPESNLDFKNQLIVLDTISALAAEGLTCIFNTHYPAHALRRANKALLLSADGSYRFGETRQTLTEEAIGKLFGVQAVIDDIETPTSVVREVVPLALAEGNAPAAENASDRRVIAVLSVIAADRAIANRLNAILHEYSGDLIGRMGMPYRKGGMQIISLMLDAPLSRVHQLTDRLGLLPGVSVKATLAKEMNQP